MPASVFQIYEERTARGHRYTAITMRIPRLDIAIVLLDIDAGDCIICMYGEHQDLIKVDRKAWNPVVANYPDFTNERGLRRMNLITANSLHDAAAFVRDLINNLAYCYGVALEFFNE